MYSADEADDGPITFEVNFMDLAGNPGVPITVASDSLVITMDGTLPEITEVNLSSNNPYDKSWAVKGDSLFLQFNSSEELKDIIAKVGNVETELLIEEDLKFVFIMSLPSLIRKELSLLISVIKIWLAILEI